jgi:hypothetical protein
MGIANPERDVDDASTKKERNATVSVAERYILSVGKLAGSPGSEMLERMSYDGGHL